MCRRQEALGVGSSDNQRTLPSLGPELKFSYARLDLEALSVLGEVRTEKGKKGKDSKEAISCVFVLFLKLSRI